MTFGLFAGSPLCEAQTFSDPLLPDVSRVAGKALDKTAVAEGGGVWSSSKELTITEKGASASAPSGAHLAIPVIAGKIRLEADIAAKGSGFTGLALGKANLTNNFWNSLSVMVTVMGERYNVYAGKKDLIAQPDKSLLKSDGPNHIEFVLDTVARTVTLKINGKMALENEALPKDAQIDRISTAGFRFHEPVTAGQPTLSHFKVGLESTSVAGLEPLDLGMCFVRPDEKQVLRWRPSTAGPSKEIPFLINDYQGNQIEAGNAALGEDGLVTLSRSFAKGYSEIVFPGAGQTFGIVAIEPHEGPADSFFGIDAGLSWLEMDPVKREALVKIASRSGIAIARERLGLGNVTSGKGKFDFETARKFDSLRKNYADSNLPILEILDGGKSMKPGNFPEMAASLTEVAKHWKVWGGAEASNEPDLLPVPASEYLPMVKTMSYALSQAQSKAPLVVGAFATIPPGPYFDTCQANGMLDDSDAVSFHSYDRAPGVEAMVARYRTWLKAGGKEAMPLWHTECGWPWVNGPPRPPHEQDAASGLEIAAKAAESMACGVKVYFPFVYVYYEEGLKNFAMMGREATPLRNMAAYVNCIRNLSGRKYLGDLKGLAFPVKLARVFGSADGKECVAVIYTGTLDSAAKVPFPIKVKSITAADGRALQMEGGMLPVGDGIAYVSMDVAEVKALLDTDTPAMRLHGIGENPLVQKRRASPLLLQFLPEQTPNRASSRRYLISSETARELPLNVRVHNLSGESIEFTPELRLPGKDGEKSGMVTVPAMGFQDVSWKLNATKALDIARTKLVVVAGTASSEIQPLPLAIPLIMEGDLDQHMTSHRAKISLPINDLPKWQANIAGHGKSTFSVTAEGAWKLGVKFSNPTGSWTYPKFTLPEKIDTNTYSGILLRARIANAGGNVAIIAGTPGAPSFWVPDLFPTDGQWHVVYIPFAEFKPGPGGAGNQNTRLDPAAWESLSIGMSTKVPENSMEVSHFVLVGGSGE